MNVKENYQSALAYLYSFIDFSRSHQENISAENFELARMVDFLRVLNNPHQDYPSIHIAGTKGKGSVAALCAAALAQAGYKVGLYTSPHLEEFTERIQINAEPVSKPGFTALVENIKPFVEQIPHLTSYEIQTALAFRHFSQQKVDIAVIEVGMGGRLDSTNVITPLVSVITNISLDHTAILGGSLAEIAREKGGIIKPHVPVVVAKQEIEAAKVLMEMAGAIGAPLVSVADEIQVQAVEKNLDGQLVSLAWGRRPALRLSLGLLGPHQLENAAAAYAALELVGQAGFEISPEAVQRGFAQVRWPGRFEIINHQPPVIIDAAHNRESARVLARTVEEYYPGLPVTLVFGALADKDIPGMFAELLPGSSVLLLVRPDHPRAASLESLRKLSKLSKDHALDVYEEAHMDKVWERALALTGAHGMVLATGSLTTIGELRSDWFKRHSSHPAQE